MLKQIVSLAPSEESSKAKRSDNEGKRKGKEAQFEKILKKKTKQK